MTLVEERRKLAGMTKFFHGERARVHIALLTVQLGYGLYYVLTKVAMSGGVNRFVFAVYRDGIALCLIGPMAYLSEKHLRTVMTLPTFLYICALGFTGIFLQQNLFLAGLSYTNTAFAAAMQNAIPVFTFIIAVLVRYEVIRFTKPDGIAKVIGMTAAVLGSFVMCLYKGPVLFGEDPSPAGQNGKAVNDMVEAHGWFASKMLGYGMDVWQIGALCLVANCFCMGVYTNLQIPALRRYPAPVSLAASSIFVGAVALLITGTFSVAKASDWVLSTPGNIVSVIYAGAVASGLSFTLLTWANQKGGPVLVAIYIPLQTVFSAFLGVVILDDPLYLGSVVGAVLILSGLYLVIWGQRLHRLAKERECLSAPFTAATEDIREPLLKPEAREKKLHSRRHGTLGRQAYSDVVIKSLIKSSLGKLILMWP
ncbi:hypothetical protein R1sor_011587 [Riccia sorocarpa]|uniref:EamA domain-containing protein n=1 Tax=Riccia sorocarpa TaxID=122646 RepID=A0ABD3I5K2_9MARC